MTARERRQEPGRRARQPEGPRIHERVGPLDVDQFGSVIPLHDGPPAHHPVDVDEFGHVGLMSKVEFTPTKRRREVGKLTQLFSEHGWAGTGGHMERMIENGWTAGRIAGEGQLLETHEWYCRQLGTSVELRLGEVGGYKPGGIRYDSEEGKWVLHMDLTKPQFEFRRFEKYEDNYLMHEHTHERQGRLMGLGTVGMLNNTYSAGDRSKYSALLGFRDWERDFSMPPVFLTPEQQRRVGVLRDGKEIARQARDIHADATALRSGYRYVKVNEREAALGLTPLTKTLLEYVFETLNYLPQNLDLAYGDQFDARQNIPLIARFRAVCNGLAKSVEGLSQGERDSMLRCLDLVGSRMENAEVSGHTVASLRGDTIGARLASMADLFDWQPNNYFTLEQKSAYDTLVDVYSNHLLFCMDRGKALREVGVETLVNALNDDKDPRMRARAANYLGEIKSVEALKALTDRIAAERDEAVQRSIAEAGIEILGEHHPEAAVQLMDELFKRSGNILDFLGNAMRLHLAVQKSPEEGLRLLREYAGAIPFLSLGFTQAVAAVGMQKPDEVIAEVIRPKLNEDYWEYRGWGVRWLGAIGEHHPDKAIPVILEGVREEKDPPINRARAAALGRIGLLHPGKVIPAAVKLLSEEKSGVAGVGAEALGMLAEKHLAQAFRAVEPLLASADKKIRENAVVAVGEIGKFDRERAKALLMPLVAGGVRDEWAPLGQAFGTMYEGDEAGLVSAVSPILDSRDKAVRKIALIAYATYGADEPEAALRLLGAQLDAGDAEAKADVGFAIGDLGLSRPAAVFPVVERLLGDGDWEKRFAGAVAAMTLCDRYKEDAWKLIVKAAGDENPVVSLMASQFMDSMPKPEITEWWGWRREKLPEIIEADVESMNHDMKEHRERCRETGWAWTNVSWGEDNLPATYFFMSRLGVKADDEGIEKDFVRLLERDGSRSALDYLAFHYYGRQLGLKLPYDGRYAEALEKPRWWSEDDHQPDYFLAAYVFHRRGLGLSFDVEGERVNLQKALDRYRGMKEGGSSILSMHYYMRQLGVGAEITDGDMDAIQEEFNRRRRRRDGDDLAEMHYMLRQLFGGG